MNIIFKGMEERDKANESIVEVKQEIVVPVAETPVISIIQQVLLDH